MNSISATLVKKIQYKDLYKLNTLQVAINVLLPYPFLISSWILAAYSYYPLALIFSYFFFAASFRQAHDGFHQTLGIGKKATDKVLYISSLLLLMSNHATLATHLDHHKNTLSETDMETKFSRYPWYIAFVCGFSFWFLSQVHGYKISAPHNRKKIYMDYLLATVALLVILTTQYTFLLYHLITMLIGHSLVGFLAGWCMHHGCDEEMIARTERNTLVNALTFNLFYHHEHHLFPRVPSNHLPELAQRIDSVLPEFSANTVIPHKRN